MPALATFDRPKDLTDKDDPRVLYSRSYLLIRAVIGAVGVLLPTLLFILDWALLRGTALLRGSLSAYYHSPARDLFVGGLCVTGFFLVTYMAGQKWTWDYRLSTIAGIAVLGVAFLPTKRPNLGVGDPLCGSIPMPRGCTQLQQALGETAVAAIHYASAATFILTLAALCFVFAHREVKFADEIETGKRRARFHRLCAWSILTGVIWVALGEALDLKVLGIHPLYMGEVMSVYAFGLSWTAKAFDLYKIIFRRTLLSSHQSDSPPKKSPEPPSKVKKAWPVEWVLAEIERAGNRISHYLQGTERHIALAVSIVTVASTLGFGKARGILLFLPLGVHLLGHYGNRLGVELFALAGYKTYLHRQMEWDEPWERIAGGVIHPSLSDKTYRLVFPLITSILTFLAFGYSWPEYADGKAETVLFVGVAALTTVSATFLWLNGKRIFGAYDDALKIAEEKTLPRGEVI